VLGTDTFKVDKQALRAISATLQSIPQLWAQSAQRPPWSRAQLDAERDQLVRLARTKRQASSPSDEGAPNGIMPLSIAKSSGTNAVLKNAHLEALEQRKRDPINPSKARHPIQTGAKQARVRTLADLPHSDSDDEAPASNPRKKRRATSADDTDLTKLPASLPGRMSRIQGVFNALEKKHAEEDSEGDSDYDSGASMHECDDPYEPGAADSDIQPVAHATRLKGSIVRAVPAPTDLWQCIKCTYKNAPGADHCGGKNCEGTRSKDGIIVPPKSAIAKKPRHPLVVKKLRKGGFRNTAERVDFVKRRLLKKANKENIISIAKAFGVKVTTSFVPLSPERIATLLAVALTG